MNKLKCSVGGCERLREGKKDYCLPHFRQLKKYGVITNIIIELRDKNRGCLVPGCPEVHCGSGYCERHYGQVRLYGKVVYEKRVNKVSNGTKMKMGYMYVLKKDHPSADKRGYVKRSWLVWEENTGHVATPPEIVHHKNEIKTDDAFDNLKLLPNKKAHRLEHGGRIGGIRIVTKQMACSEMARVSALIGGEKLTTRKFAEYSTICSGVIRDKFGWGTLKEELCIK